MKGPRGRSDRPGNRPGVGSVQAGVTRTVRERVGLEAERVAPQLGTGQYGICRVFPRPHSSASGSADRGEPRRRAYPRGSLVVPAVVLALATAAGCAGSDDGASAAYEVADAGSDGDGGVDIAEGAPGPEETDAQVTDEAAAEAGGGTAGGGDGAGPLALDTVAMARARDVVRTGTMQLTVDDVDATATDVRRLATDAGGFVADEQVRARNDEVDMTVRVPADRFDDVRGRIGELGDVSEQNVEASDVTAEVVDVESRIASLRASVVRVRGLLSQSGDVAQLALVEGELARREAELEALVGQQRVLRDQVDLATLTVHMSEEEAPSPSDDAPGFADGLRRGWVAAVDGGRIALAVAGFALPFLVPAALVTLGVRRWQRRRPAVAPAE
jgi:hypothetical protein